MCMCMSLYNALEVTITGSPHPSITAIIFQTLLDMLNCLCQPNSPAAAAAAGAILNSHFSRKKYKKLIAFFQVFINTFCRG